MYLENSGCVHVMAETALSSRLLTRVGLSFLEEVFRQKCPLLKKVWKVTRHLATTALWVMKLTFEYICMKWVGRTETFLAVVSSFSTRKQITYGDHTNCKIWYSYCFFQHQTQFWYNSPPLRAVQKWFLKTHLWASANVMAEILLFYSVNEQVRHTDKS